MRIWVLVFLLVLLPLQSAWASAASYCRHETGVAAKHVGHHEHRHIASGNTDVSSDQRAGGGLDDVDGDCGYCHLHCAQAIANPAVLSLERSREPVVSSVLARYVTRAPDGLERPNWRPLVCSVGLEEARIR
ncbi:DUF2946 family protein [Piscinibacter koreensis]|uniref:Cobalt-zinc-cadmium resistance protein n=1 Tax=Piscinibacter koreensis TaxID=2742824 RepID=A0A7Y6NTU4_9BURK|nr:DUF2946 family protein [Schlegelella koreensis]NUZ09082.1 hypothetical protein [Schlegelella koreensis]